MAAPRSQRVVCLYFAAEEAPIDEPILMLNGERDVLVNNVAVMSAVAPSYAPPGAALISATVLGDPALDDAALEHAVRDALGRWFGAPVQRWRHLRTYRIQHALPAQVPPTPERPVAFGPGFYICGDHRDQASIQGAMVSGIRTARAILADLN
jgi:predicted NAD/FAD-dependent oxidoreductase